MTSQTADIDRLWIRLNAHAEDITKLTRRLEEVYREHRNAIFCLKSDTRILNERLETLVVEQAGNDRRFREVISDNAELACCVERLEQRHEGLVLAVAGLAKHEGNRTEELAEHIEELESWLAFLTARHNRIAEPAAQERKDLTRRIDGGDEAALELAQHIAGLVKRIRQLERLLERGQKKEDQNGSGNS